MSRYIDNLVRYVRREKKAEVSKMIQEMRELSGFQRELCGRAILHLKPKVIGEELGMYLVKLGREREIETEIKVGDEVILSRKNPLKSDIKGIVVEKGKRYIVVSLNQLPPRRFDEVRVDLYASDITYRRQIETLLNLTEYAENVFKYILKDLDLPEPRIKNEGVDFLDKTLNDSQKTAILKALNSDGFFLIHGPFGTGKTKTLVEYIIQEVKSGKKVLVSTDSNLAVDNIVERIRKYNIPHVRIGHPSRVSRNLLESTLLYKLEHHERASELEELRNELQKLIDSRENFQKPIPKYRRGLSDEQILELAKNNKTTRGIPKYIIENMAEWINLNMEISSVKRKIERIENEIVEDILQKSMVVFLTNTSSYLLEDKIFDVCVVDEATQSTIPSILIPLSKAKKFVLAGDHKQLPPTVLEAKELSKTLFEILIKKYPQKSAMLNIQYRMNEKLMEFPNKEFYDGKLISAVSNITLKDLDFNSYHPITNPENVLIFIDTSKSKEKSEMIRRDSTSYYNVLEAEIVKKIVKLFLKEGAKKEWIGVITPYAEQVNLIESFNLDVKVSTVDGFQGQEKEIIIISFVRSNENGDIGFLEDLRRLNVSLTRPKRKLIIIGDKSTISVHPTYKKLIDFIKQRGLVIEEVERIYD